MALQVTLLLLTLTETATVGGFEAYFERNSLLGVRIKPTTLIILSIIWSLKTLILMHVKSLSLEKGYFRLKVKFVAFLWGLVSSMKRVIVIVSFFVPSLGLFDLLWHWHAEQYPFQVRLDLAKRSNMTQDAKIKLYNMTEEVSWSDLDRWCYENPQNPKAPDYDLYTGLTAKWSLATFFLILFLHLVAVFLVKWYTSDEFRMGKGTVFQKSNHVILNTNIPRAFRDWDYGNLSLEEHRRRYRRTEKEMVCLILVNQVFNLMLLVPLWYTGMIKLPVNIMDIVNEALKNTFFCAITLFKIGVLGITPENG